MGELLTLKKDAGSHRIREKGKYRDLKPGELVDAKLIKKAFMDKFEPYQPEEPEEEKEEAPEPEPEPELELTAGPEPDLEPDLPSPDLKDKLKVEHKGGGYYNVINVDTGKPINDEPLRKEQAQELINANLESK